MARSEPAHAGCRLHPNGDAGRMQRCSRSARFCRVQEIGCRVRGTAFVHDGGLMRRGRVWRRRLTRAAATVGIGALLGFLVPSIIQDMSPRPEVLARTAESPMARQFITAYLADDQPTLDLLKIPAATKAKSARVKAEYVQVDPPAHLGSWTIGQGSTLHAYSSHVVGNDGSDDQLAWRVVTAQGQVQLIDPPPSQTQDTP